MSILQKIIENKKHKLEENKSNSKKFREIFNEKNASIIWEIKLASPKFDYSEKINLEDIFRFYWENKQIKAISNLIDEKYFSWDISRWKNFKQKYNKPIFFKEFVVSKTQIDWANYFWYDAILLLERVLSEKEIIEFVNYSNEKNIFPIIEVDTEKWMEKVLNIWKQNNNSPIIPFHKGDEDITLKFWIAINCRNLWTMKIDRKRHFEIYDKFSEKLENKLVFAFSWIDNLKQVEEYKNKFNWVLVGSYFMEQFIKE